MSEIKEQILKLKEKARRDYIPIVRDKTIVRIAQILQEENCKNLLEIGTGIGYSGILMLLSSPNSILTSIEKDEIRFNEAKKEFENFNLLKRANLINDDALNALETLLKEGKAFDFIFLDGPKGQYIKYLPLIKKLLSENGILFSDNLKLGGILLDESKITHKNRSMAENMKKFIQILKTDQTLETQFYDIDDGFSISKIKKHAE